MDMRQLRHFLAVADTLHFGRAAERLGMTQPPLSQSIIALERELGASLFTRSKRHVALTAFGRQWLHHVRPAVDAVGRLDGIARDLRMGKAGRLALSFVSTADYSLLPQLVERFASAYPDVQLSLLEATSDLQVDALLQHKVDVGILIPTRPTLPRSLAYQPLLSEPLVAAVPAAWVDDGRVSVADGRLIDDSWMDEPLILFPARVAPDFHDLVMNVYQLRGRTPIVRQEAIQMQTIISLVSAGMGVALVPQSLRNLSRTGVRYLALASESPLLETGLAWHRDNDSPVLAAFTTIARHLAPER